MNLLSYSGDSSIWSLFRPSDKEVLAARFIDRALRPLFPPGYYYDTQLVSTVMSYDSSGPIDPVSSGTAVLFHHTLSSHNFDFF